VEYAEFSHDGKMIVTSAETTLKIWDASDGHFLFSFKGVNNHGYPAQFSPDDKSVATFEKGLVKIWSIADRELISSYQAAANCCLPNMNLAPENMVRNCRFSNDGRYLITSYFDSSVYIRDIVNSRELALVKEKVSNADISKDGKMIIAVVKNKVNIYNIDSGKIVFTYPVKSFPAPVVSLGYSNNLFLKADENVTGDNFSEIFSLPEGKLVEKINVGGYLNSASLSNSDSFLLHYDFAKKSILVNQLRRGKSLGPPDIFTWHSRQLDITFTSNSDTIISYSDDSLVRIWNFKKGELYNTYRVPAHPYITAKYLFYIEQHEELLKQHDEQSGNTFDTLVVNDTIVVKNPVTGATIKEIPVNDYGGEIFVSPDNKVLVVDEGFLAEHVRIIDINSQKILKKLTKSSSNPVDKLFFIPKSQKILVTDQILVESAAILDINTGGLYFTIKNHEGEEFEFSDFIHDFSFSPDGKFIASASDSLIKIFNVQTRKYIKTLKYKEGVSVSAFSPDNKYFVYGLKDGTLIIADPVNFSTIRKTKLNNNYIYKLVFSEDSKYLLTAAEQGEINLLETTSFNSVKHISAEKNDRLQKIDFKSQRLFVSNGAVVGIYDLSKEKKLYSFASFLKNDFIFLLSNNFYYTTPAAATVLAWKNKESVYSFNQFDTKYNRPDIVLKTLGEIFHNTDTMLINAYSKAYEKRVRRLGIDTISFREGFNVPVVDIVNRDSIAYLQDHDHIKLHIKGSDSTSTPERFNIWVNDVPEYGQRGIDMRNRNRNDIDTVIAVSLLPGENKIETSIINLNGIESYRVPLDIKYTPASSVNEKLYFIGIGIDHFNDSKYNLSWSVKDIRDLATAFKDKYGTNCIVKTLFDKDVNTENVKALKRDLLNTTENDKVIVAYSGHGLLSDSLDYFLSTFNVNFHKPEVDGLPYESLEDLLDGIPARKKLMLIDACHSGEVDKEELSRMVAVQNDLDPTKKGVIVLEDTSSEKLGMKNSFELMLELFANVGRNTGATIISAAAGTQFALEKGDLKNGGNGIFTSCILELMKQKNNVKISELKKYVNERVTELTQGMQVPTSRNENMVMDWEVW